MQVDLFNYICLDYLLDMFLRNPVSLTFNLSVRDTGSTLKIMAIVIRNRISYLSSNPG